MKKIIALLSILTVSILSGVTFGNLLDVNPLLPGAISFIGSFMPMPGLSLYSLVFTSPAAAGTYAFPLNYVPEFLIYDAAAAPLTTLTVNEQNDGVLLNLPAAGILQIRAFMRYGLVASTVTMFRLANGHIRNKNVQITLVQPGAVAIPFFVCSDQPGNTEFIYNTVNLLAGTPMPFEKFTCLFLPNLAAGDTILVEFASGHNQLFNREELLELSAQYQNSQLAGGFMLNNINSYISKATVTQAAAGNAYVYKANLR